MLRGLAAPRGELDKIIERSTFTATKREYEERPPKYREHGDKHYYKKKKRESFLGDLFDFG